MSRLGYSLALTTVFCNSSFSPRLALADVFNMPAGQTSLGMVPVGNPGNANSSTGEGSVGYTYDIGKFETTIGQYTQFLNAVAATDTYGLYNPNMATNLNIAGIARSGSSGSYTYSTIGSPNRPVTFVSWGDSARFANWITNGQPTGAQGPGTTETGSYALNGATTDAALLAVTRNANAHFVIPSENEWYKAAYYDPTKGGGDYWLYPMRTDAVPHSAQPPGSGAPIAAFTGNFYQDDGITNTFDNGYAVTGSTSLSSTQNYLTDVGAYTSASSFYSTFDQGGNVFEWDEGMRYSYARDLRGGSWSNSTGQLQRWDITNYFPTSESSILGFRVSEVPEPATLTLFGLAAAAMICRLSRQRKT